MKIRLILAKTEFDYTTAWAAIKTVEVEIPQDAQDGWNVIGAEWPGKEQGDEH